MLTLRVLVRAPPEKRQELIQALGAFIPEPSARPCRRLLLQAIDDEDLVCWIGEWRERDELDRFLSSETYRALRGAATVLGQLEDVVVAESCSDL